MPTNEEIIACLNKAADMLMSGFSYVSDKTMRFEMLSAEKRCRDIARRLKDDGDPLMMD